MQTLTSSQELVAASVGAPFYPTPLEPIWSWCHCLNASRWGQPQAKWPGDPHTKHCCSSCWYQLTAWTRHTLMPPAASTSDPESFPVTWSDSVDPSSFKGCHPACRCDIAPMFVPIHLRARGIPVCMCRLSLNASQWGQPQVK